MLLSSEIFLIGDFKGWIFKCHLGICIPLTCLFVNGLIWVSGAPSVLLPMAAGSLSKFFTSKEHYQRFCLPHGHTPTVLWSRLCVAYHTTSVSGTTTKNKICLQVLEGSLQLNLCKYVANILSVFLNLG